MSTGPFSPPLTSVGGGPAVRWLPSAAGPAQSPHGLCGPDRRRPANQGSTCEDTFVILVMGRKSPIVLHIRLMRAHRRFAPDCGFSATYPGGVVHKGSRSATPCRMKMASELLRRVPGDKTSVFRTLLLLSPVTNAYKKSQESGRTPHATPAPRCPVMVTANPPRSVRTVSVGMGSADYGVDAGDDGSNLPCLRVDCPNSLRSPSRQIKTPRKAGRRITTTTLWTRGRYQLKSLLGGGGERNTCCVSIKLTNR